MFLDEGCVASEKGVATKMQVSLNYILEKIKSGKYTVLRTKKEFELYTEFLTANTWYMVGLFLFFGGTSFLTKLWYLRTKPNLTELHP